VCYICKSGLDIGFDRRRRKCAACKKKTQEARQKRRAERLKEDRRLSHEDRQKRNELEERLLAEAIKEAVIEFDGPTWQRGTRFQAKLDVKNRAVVGAHGELSTRRPLWLGDFTGDMASTKRRLVLELLEKWGYEQVRDLASNEATPQKGSNESPPVPE
jgi:hypothetical protein